MGKENHDYELNRLKTYEYWSIFLHENQSYVGRSYIALKREGEIDPFLDTTDEERAELLLVMAQLKEAIDKLYQPDRLNYANLRNTWLHCHWHVIPRYSSIRNVNGTVFDDPNWGANYAPAHERDISSEVYEKIRADLAAALEEE